MSSKISQLQDGGAVQAGDHLLIQRGSDNFKVTAEAFVGPQGSAGDTGPEGPQGDPGAPGTTDYNDLTNKPTIPTATSQLSNDSGFLTSAPVSSVAGKTGVVTLVKADVGLGNVDNTSDSAKPVSSATQTALNLKAALNAPSFSGNITLNAQAIVTDTTTGLQIGTSGTQKLGFYGVTPVVRPSAFTQTYSTASKTHAAITQLAAPAGGTGTAAGGWSTAANRDLAITSINAARNDIANIKQVLNAVIDDLQAQGLLQ